MTDDTLPTPEQQSQQLPQTKTSWRTMLWRVLTTPLSFGRQSVRAIRPSVDSAIAAANLPVELAALVRTVVRATRLWASERADVARELSAHFRDGLDAGGVVADLRDQFGDSHLVARLIRTSRIRCRPSWWHAWRYSLRCAALLIVLYLCLAVRFFLSRPNIARNYLREFNDQVRAIPEEQRAWPLYRAALKLRRPYAKLEPDQSRDLEEGWWTAEHNRVDRESLAWKQMLLFVEENQVMIQRIHEAAKRPVWGVIYGDPEDNPPNTDSEEDKPLVIGLLPQIQEMRDFSRLLTADATVAAAVGDGNRLANDLHSLILMAEQSHGHWLVEDLISTVILRDTTSVIRDSLEKVPNLLTDNQLVEVAHRLAIYYGGGTVRFDLGGQKTIFDDILQRCYTDDGQGNGSLTPDGLKLLEELTRLELWGQKDDHGPANVFKSILDPAVMLRAMSRRELREIGDRYFAESRSLRRGPPYTWGASDARQEFFQQEGHRYAVGDSKMVTPIFVLISIFKAIVSCDSYAERLCQVRDGTLTAIALELYHRRHSDWPETLEQLVPRELPELPQDRFTGQTLRYRVQDGRPFVYACGMDQQDDGGRHPSLLQIGELEHQQIFNKPATPPVPGTGYDWVLFPRPRQSPQDHE